MVDIIAKFLRKAENFEIEFEEIIGKIRQNYF